MAPGAGNEAYLSAMERVEQTMEEFKPQFVLISSGFDAHMADPLAHIQLNQKGYEALTRSVKKHRRNLMQKEGSSRCSREDTT